ncbi:hypothetical protein OAT84_02805 [Gammaproteobacteria bacterium]|nr:hypothetical protein [Gammaproteobacteria bacterium]
MKDFIIYYDQENYQNMRDLLNMHGIRPKMKRVSLSYVEMKTNSNALTLPILHAGQACYTEKDLIAHRKNQTFHHIYGKVVSSDYTLIKDKSLNECFTMISETAFSQDHIPEPAEIIAVNLTTHKVPALQKVGYSYFLHNLLDPVDILSAIKKLYHTIIPKELPIPSTSASILLQHIGFTDCKTTCEIKPVSQSCTL